MPVSRSWPWQAIVVTSPNGERLRVAYLSRPGRGVPVFCLHGMGSSRLAFWPWFQRTRLENPLYALDLPGYGASSLPRRRQTLEDMVWAAWAAAQELVPDRPRLWVGHSMGGMVAAEAALREPRNAVGVILIAGAGIIAPQNTFQPTPWPWVNRLGIWVTGTAWFGVRILRAMGLDPDRVGTEDRARLRYGWRAAREMARFGRFYESPNLLARLREAGVPVVGLWGDRDIIFPLAQVEAATRGALPIRVMSGAGHLPMDYDLERFDAELSSMIGELCREREAPA